MNFFSWHIGDYLTRTVHLNWEEDMAYRRMLELYYSTERPLPADKGEIARLIRAECGRHKKAIENILSEFFVLTDRGYENVRCNEEIEKFKSKSSKASQSARMRWDNREHSDGNADAMRSHSEGNATNTNTSTSTNSGVVYGEADLEKSLREAAGWQSNPAPNLFLTGPIQSMIEAGADLEMDILPTIKALSGKCRTPNWNYFIPAIRAALAKRLDAAKPLTSEEIAHARKAKRHRSRSESFAIVNDLIAEAERRENEAGIGGGGEATVGATRPGPRTT